MTNEKKQYNKPILNYEELAELLLKKRLIAEKSKLILVLQAMSYYRLSAYLFPYKNRTTGQYHENTSLDAILNIYNFDRELRLLVFDAIESVESSIRNNVIHTVGLKHGVFSYKEQGTFLQYGESKFNDICLKINNETKRSKEIFVKHFFDTYQGDDLPIWMLTEVMSFGTLLILFKGISFENKKIISDIYSIHPRIFESWLLSIKTIRNICAHHSRLWNRGLEAKPMIPNKAYAYDNFYINNEKIQNEKIFCILTILKYLLDIINKDHVWDKKLQDLLDNYKNINLCSMGFPENWKTSPIWKK